MAWFTQRDAVGQCIFSSVLAKLDMMGFQAYVASPTVLARIAVSHQTGHAQVSIKIFAAETHPMHGIGRSRALRSACCPLRGPVFDENRQTPHLELMPWW